MLHQAEKFYYAMRIMEQRTAGLLEALFIVRVYVV
jgi:hypothetical protein